MKKLFFASIVMLASLQSCNNSEGQINSEEAKLSNEELQHYINAKKISMNMESDSFLKQIEQ